MKRIVFHVPELIGGERLVRPSSLLVQLAERGKLFRLNPVPEVETPEALYLGMTSLEGQMRQGPLTIAALGADPPDRSTHFHLSFLSFDDGMASAFSGYLSAEEQAVLVEAVRRLDTKSLTFVKGEGVDHGLVWEGLADFATSSPLGWVACPISDEMPRGEIDLMLRRYIDDSINLLSELDLNRRRLDEEKAPINLLWPWGNGVRFKVPNLALRRGEPAMVFGRSMRLQGLARLAGYRFTKLPKEGTGLGLRFDRVPSLFDRTDLNIVLVDEIAQLRTEEKLEEAEWFVAQLDEQVIRPVVERAVSRAEAVQVSVLAPGGAEGLGFTFNSRNEQQANFPFDERALEEKALLKLDLDQAVRAAIEEL